MNERKTTGEYRTWLQQIIAPHVTAVQAQTEALPLVGQVAQGL